MDSGLKQRITEAERFEQKLALLYIDLDNFKVVNDSVGQEKGDLLLKRVAERKIGRAHV